MCEVTEDKGRSETKMGNKILMANWKGGFPVIMVIYISLEIIVTFVCTILANIFTGYEIYKDAQHPAIAILFWIVIIQFNFNLFEKTYKELKIYVQNSEVPLVKSKELEEWKRKVKEEFDFSIDIEEGFLLIIIVCFEFWCYFSFGKVNNDIIDEYKYGCQMGIVFLIAIMGLSLLDCKEKKIFKISCFVAICGLSYYIYIIKIYDNPLPALVSDEHIFINILIMCCVICVFFIAGLAINPLICSFKVFYFLNLREILNVRHAQISNTIVSLKCIKKYFQSLTVSSLVAYFQLLWIVWSLGILDKKEIVTIILFVLGTVFPLAMFVAGNYYFKKLCNELFLEQIGGFENKISKWINRDEKFDKVQTLIDLRKCYMEDLDFKLIDDVEMFLATFLPIVISGLTLANNLQLI